MNKQTKLLMYEAAYIMQNQSHSLTFSCVLIFQFKNPAVMQLSSAFNYMFFFTCFSDFLV